LRKNYFGYFAVNMVAINKRLAIGATTLLLATAAVVATSSHLSKGVALLKSNPKEVVEEVWQVVNFSYVDGTFNKTDWDALRRKYVVNGEYKNKEEAYKGVREMLKKLGDPYTRFMSPKEFNELSTDISGVLVGVGMQLTQDPKTKKLVVVAPIDDTPASKAGILSKDVIVKINGKSTKGLDVNKAVEIIRGEEGTFVTISVQRGTEAVVDHKLRRQKIDVHSVKAEYRKDDLGGVGYIRLNQFSANATKEMKEAIQQMEAKNVNGYVLDLRSNPGGLLPSAIGVSRLFMNEGTIVSTRNRNGSCNDPEPDCKKKADGTALTNKPMVVLVNDGSASASEIVAGALQDNGRAILVGQKTFGKGLVQSVRQLSDGSGLAVTIAKYYTPNGKDINKLGIQPDVKVGLKPADVDAIRKDRKRLGTIQDPQYARALKALEVRIAAANAPPTAKIPNDLDVTSPAEGVPIPVPSPNVGSPEVIPQQLTPSDKPVSPN
jgi:carboxyl-terminal processing protease